MNKNDSEHLAGMFEFDGFKPEANPHKADVVILNTCAIRETAERKVIGRLHRLNHARKIHSFATQKLFLAGCMPAYNKAELQQKLPFIDGFIEIEEARKYPSRRENSRQAWVAIMSGCNNFCSYCIVPYARGREKSRTAEEIMAELKTIDYTKQDLLYLLGQNVNSYTGTMNGKKIDFPTLLETIIIQFPQIPHFNFMTSHPKDMSDHLIELIGKYPKIDREIHFPLQSGNNRILELMHRGYTYEHYRDLVKKLRAKAPDVRISTDFIVGFPGETEAEFEDTLRAVRELRFARVNTAAYSVRSGTASATMEGQLSTEIKSHRLQKLIDVVDQTAHGS